MVAHLNAVVAFGLIVFGWLALGGLSYKQCRSNLSIFVDSISLLASDDLEFNSAHEFLPVPIHSNQMESPETRVEILGIFPTIKQPSSHGIARPNGLIPDPEAAFLSGAVVAEAATRHDFLWPGPLPETSTPKPHPDESPMREFFHGWRRKLGCVTLVMACIIALMGQRSRIRLDEFTIHHGTTTHAIKSHDGRLCWSRIQPEYSNSLFNWRSEETEWQSVEFWQPPTEDRIWIVNGSGFTFGAIHYAHTRSPINKIWTSNRCDFWMIPYWSIAAASTLLSAYLILWKPRKRS